MSADPLRAYARFQARINNLDPDQYERQIAAESSFRADAVSPRGARGIAQFMPETGRAYGLETDDDFRDPLKGLAAGAAHMRDLTAQAQGDQRAALVGYNAGPRRMLSYLKKRNTASLPRETQSYVGQIATPPEDDGGAVLERFKRRLGGAVTETSKTEAPLTGSPAVEDARAWREGHSSDMGNPPQSEPRRSLGPHPSAALGKDRLGDDLDRAQIGNTSTAGGVRTINSATGKQVVEETENVSAGAPMNEGEVYRQWYNAYKGNDYQNAALVGRSYLKQFPEGKYRRWIEQSLSPLQTGREPSVRRQGSGSAPRGAQGADIYIEDLLDPKSKLTPGQVSQIAQDRHAAALGFDESAIEVFRQKYGYHPGVFVGREGSRLTPDQLIGQMLLFNKGGVGGVMKIRVPGETSQFYEDFLNSGLIAPGAEMARQAGNRTRAGVDLGGMIEGAGKVFDRAASSISGIPDDPELRHRTAQDLAKDINEFSAGFAQGGLQTVGGTAKGAGLLLGLAARSLHPEMPDAKTPISDFLVRAGDAISTLASGSLDPEDPNQISFSRQMGQGFGSSSAFMVMGAGGEALSLPSSLVSGITGALGEMSQVYDTLRQHGYDHNRAVRLSLWGLPIGATEAAGIGGVMGRATTGGPKAALFEAIRHEIGEEFSQEYLQSLLEDFLAKRTYDPTREVKGSLDAAIIGGLTGGIMGGGTHALVNSGVAQRFEQRSQDRAIIDHFEESTARGVSPDPALVQEYHAAVYREAQREQGITPGLAGENEGTGATPAERVAAQRDTLLGRPMPSVVPTVHTPLNQSVDPATVEREVQQTVSLAAAQQQAEEQAAAIDQTPQNAENGGDVLQSLRDGRRRAVLVKPGEPMPTLHGAPATKGAIEAAGFAVTKTDVGTFIHRTKNVSRSQVKQQARDGSYHKLLEEGERAADSVPAADTSPGATGAAPTTVEPQPSAIPQEVSNAVDEGTESAPVESPALISGTNSLIRTVKGLLLSGQKVNNRALTTLADEAFGGTRAKGTYGVKDSTDAVEVAVNQIMEQQASDLLKNDPPSESLSAIRLLLEQLPRQDDRTTAQIELQQFSTPPTEAFVAAVVLDVQPGDIVLEPSAGTGSLAVWARAAGARVIANEIDPRRRALLQLQGFQTTNVDAQFLNDLLPTEIRPTAIMMNPPFSATGGRVERHDSKYGAEHVADALKRLAPNGRLVAIVSEGMALDKPRMAKWWARILSEYNVRANISVPGEEYGKYGTTYGNQILVIDKTGPTPGDSLLQRIQNVLQSAPENLEGVLDALNPIISDRPKGGISGVAPVVRRPNRSAGQSDRVVTATRGDELLGSGHQPGLPLETPGQTGPGEGTRVVSGDQPGRGHVPAPEAGSVRPGGPIDSDAGSAVTAPKRSAADIAKRVAERLARETQKEAPSKPAEVTTPTNEVQDRRAEARKRLAALAQKKTDGELREESAEYGDSQIDPEEIVAMVDYLQTWIEDGVVRFDDAARSFIEDFGDRAHLFRRAFEVAWDELKADYPQIDSVGTWPEASPPGTEEADEAESEATFVPYKPQKLKVGKPHPGSIVESASMAAVAPPDITYTPHLDQSILDKGLLSNLQYEAVSYAGQRHEQRLANGNRAGFFVGDGTGVGKGRILAGVALDNWNQGRQRILWLSVNNDLVPSTDRDLKALGGKVPLSVISDHPASGSIDFDKGVLFSSYSTLIAKAKNGRERIDQIREWLGPDGVIMFDEAHLAKNAVTQGQKESSQRGEKVVSLQEGPKSSADYRIVYASATGATDVDNMGYMVRLGLWGPGTSFAKFGDFRIAIDQGGVGAMEMVSRDMKAMGMYTARTLSFKGVDYREVEHKLGDTQRELYDTAARAWQVVLQNFEKAIEITGADSRARSMARKRFWNDEQRFFRQFLTALKVPAAIEEIEAAMEKGQSVVLGLYGTGESRTKDQVTNAMAEGRDLDDLDFSPKQILTHLVENAYPTIRYTDATNPVTGKPIRVPVTDADGNPVESAEAKRMKQELLDQLEQLALPDNPLDQIVNHFGVDKVAEITGRKKRLVRGADGKMRYVKRVEGVSMEKASQHEMDAFQTGRKRIAIISASASTGISLHADNTAKNKQRRVHITLETGWSADVQMQTFGRTHRTNQSSAPEYVLLSTDVGGERRFLSTIAKRLASLGALTKGERKATGVGASKEEGLEKYDFLNQYGIAAVRSMVNHPKDKIGDHTVFEVFDKIGLIKENQDTGKREIVEPSVEQLLNRVLALEIGEQNAVFAKFSDEFARAVQIAKDQGAFDEGVTDVKGESIRLVGTPQVVATDKTTGAQTLHYQIEVDIKTHPMPFSEARKEQQLGQKDGAAFYKQVRSGKVILATPAAASTDYRSGVVTRRWHANRPTTGYHSSIITQNELMEKYQLLRADEVEALWSEEFENAPAVRTQTKHLIGGAILPVWERIAAKAQGVTTVRVVTDKGERILGADLPPKAVGPVLREIGVGRSFKTPDAIFKAVLDDGETINLVQSMRLEQTRYKGDDAIELFGASSRRAEELRSLGLIHEVVSYRDRFFVPTDEKKGPQVLGKLLERYPAVSGGGDAGVAERTAAYDVRESLTEKPSTPENAVVYEPRANKARARQLAQRGVNQLAAADTVSSARGNVAGERARQGGTRILGLGITRPLRTGFLDLRGKIVNSTQDVARLAQVLRNPNFETFRVIYVKSNTVVATEAISSRLPDASSPFVGRHDASRSFEEMRRRMERLGADGYYMLHNHPSGRPTPSPEDQRLTKFFAKGSQGVTPVPGFLGHVVINHGEYAVIDAEGFVQMGMFGAGKDKALTPSVEHVLLGAVITNEQHLAETAKQLQMDPSHVVLLYRSRDRVRAIEEIPLTLFTQPARFSDHLRGRLVAFGSQNVFSVSFADVGHTGKISILEAMKEGVLLDHYYVAEGKTSREKGDAPIFIRSRPTRTARRVSEEEAPYAAGEYQGFDPEIEERWQAAKGLRPEPLSSRIKEVATHLKNLATREFEHLPRTAEHAEFRFALKRLEQGRAIQSDEAVRKLHGLTSKLDRRAYDLYTRRIILDDLLEEAERQGEAREGDEEGDIRLPFGFTTDSLTAESRKLEAVLADRDDVRDAVAQRRRLIGEVTSDYLAAAKAAIGFEPKLTRRSYYRHQVLEYADASRRVKGTGGKIQAPTRRGFLKQRLGSELDINTDYLQAEHSVLAQMMYDTQVFNLLRLVDQQYNQSAGLKAEAKEANARAIQAIIDDENARGLNRPKKKVKRKSLSQFVREKGGIRPDGDLDGELERLSRKEGGTTGLVSKNARLSPDGMREAAVEAGYFSEFDDESENLGAFIEAIEKDLRGIRTIYSLQDEEPDFAGGRDMFLTVDAEMKLFRQKIGRGFSELRGLAKEGDLWTGDDDEWETAVRRLLSTRNHDEDLNERNSLFRYLAALAANEDAVGNLQARIILKAVSQRREFVKRTLGRDYKTWEDMIPDTHTLWQPREGNVFFNTFTLPEKLVNQALESFYEKIGFDAGDLRRAMVMGGRRTEFAIPTEIATTLDEFAKPPDTNPVDRGVRAVVRAWKVWQLISPHRVFKYNARNLSGDADAVFVGNPSAFLKAPRATHDLWSYLVGKIEPTAELQAWLQHGGLQNLFQVAEDVGSINGLKVFRNLATDKKGNVEKIKLWKQYWRTVRMGTDFREALLRYAAFLDYREQMQNHDGKPKNYGASIPEEVDAMSDRDDKAYKLSNDLLGAYDEVSQMGQWLRTHAFPFWSWQEVNAKRYYRFLRNAVSEGTTASDVGRKLLPKALRSTPIVTYRVGKFALKATALWAMLEAFNHLVFPDEEKDLDEKTRSRMHIVLGRRADGSVMYFDRLGMLGDLLSWFGLDVAPHHVRQFLDNKRSIAEIAIEMAKAPVNKLWQATGIPKSIAEVATGRNTYPDVFRSRNVRDRWEFLANSLGVGDEYGALAGKPKRGFGRYARGYLVYEVQPEESAYNEILSLKSDFNRKRGVAADIASGNDKSNAAYYLKLALRYGDIEAAQRYLAEYKLLGGTAAGLQSSIRSLAPLAGLNEQAKAEFLGLLTADERERLAKAQMFYDSVIDRSGEVGPADLLSKAIPKENRQPVDRELHRLGLSFPFPENEITIAGKQQQIPAEKFAEFEKRSAEGMYRELADLISKPVYQRMKDADRKLAIEDFKQAWMGNERRRLHGQTMLESGATGRAGAEARRNVLQSDIEEKQLQNKERTVIQQQTRRGLNALRLGLPLYQ